MCNTEGLQPQPKQEGFEVYGFAFRLCREAPAAIRDLASAFDFFRRAAVSDPLTVELICGDPPYDEVPEREASTYTPDTVSFAEVGLTYLDHSGRCLAIWDRGGKRLRVYRRDPHLHYEVTYPFLSLLIGEAIDSRGIHRLHAMAYQGRSVLAILPMGSGKSTLAAGLFRYPEFASVYDDSPIVSRDGKVHAFPLRLGLLPGAEQEIPTERLRVIQRMEFGPELLVSYEYFADRVKASAEPGIVFLGLYLLLPHVALQVDADYLHWGWQSILCPSANLEPAHHLVLEGRTSDLRVGAPIRNPEWATRRTVIC